MVAEKLQELDTDVCLTTNDVNIKHYSWIGVRKTLSAKQNRLVKAKSLNPWLNTNLFKKYKT